MYIRQKLLTGMLLVATVGFGSVAHAGFIGSISLDFSANPPDQLFNDFHFDTVFVDIDTISATAFASASFSLPGQLSAVSTNVGGALNVGEPLAFAFAEAFASVGDFFINTSDAPVMVTLTESVTASIDPGDAGSVDFDWFAFVLVYDDLFDIVEEFDVFEFGTVSDIGPGSFTSDRSTSFTVPAFGALDVLLGASMIGAISPGVMGVDVPEPGTLSLLLAGLLCLAWSRRKSVAANQAG